MSNVISNSLAELRKRQRELTSELNRVEKAIIALANLNEAKVVKAVREKKLNLICKHCNTLFQASRIDARFCSRECVEGDRKSKPVVLIEGAKK